jgi:hypothetical protein
MEGLELGLVYKHFLLVFVLVLLDTVELSLILFHVGSHLPLLLL